VKHFYLNLKVAVLRLLGMTRRCLICGIPMRDWPSLAFGCALCSECHALTRPLARKRRKATQLRAKLARRAVMLDQAAIQHAMAKASC
jgi:hypothetical protein